MRVHTIIIMKVQDMIKSRVYLGSVGNQLGRLSNLVLSGKVVSRKIYYWSKQSHDKIDSYVYL